MIKDLVLKSKFAFIQEFFGKIIQDIRKDVRQEHLKKDKAFIQKHFAKNSIDKVSAEEIEKGYFTELSIEGNDDLSNWVISKWILKHAEVYEYFVTELTKVNPKFEEISLLDMETAKSIAARAVDKFGAEDTLIFSVVNSVAFPDQIFEALKDEALKQLAAKKDLVKKDTAISVEDLVKQHQIDLSRLSERYENRIQAVSKKYIQDIEGLKKQLASMQKRLEGAKCS
jgi:hypothetical protein